MFSSRQCDRTAQVVFLLALVFLVILPDIPVIHGLVKPQSWSSIRRHDYSTQSVSPKLAWRESLFSSYHLSKLPFHRNCREKKCRWEASLTLFAVSSSDSKADGDPKDKKPQGTENPTAIDTIKSGLEKIVKKTGLVEEDYQFGDLTRGAVSNVTKAAVNVEESIVRTITGDEEYKFGDITKDLVTNSAESNIGLLAALVLKFYLDLPSSRLIRRLMGELLPEKEEDTTIDQKPVSTSLQIIAFLGLTLHFVLNLCHSCSVIFAWGYTSWKMRATPFQSSGAWQFFLSAQNSFRLIVGPLLLPLQVGLSFFGSIKYRNMVLKLEQQIPLRNQERYATMTRFLAFFSSYLLVNCIGTAIFTSLGCYSVGTMCRCLVK